MPQDAPHEMLNYQVRWKMFRGFRDTGWLDIRPLTVLLGPNNSGKTSLIAPLLVLKQTVMSPDVLTPLVLRGPLVDLGNFDDMAFAHNREATVFFGIRFHSHEPEKGLDPVGTYAPGALELTFESGKLPNSLVLKSYAVDDLFRRRYLRRTRMGSGSFSLSGRLFAKLRAHERTALLRARPTNFLFGPSRTLTELVRPSKRDKALRARYSNPFNLYLTVVSHVYDQIGMLLRDLTYIGPIRDRPRRYYEVSGEIPRTVGSTGEHAPHLLRYRYRNLRARLNHWARVFELASSVRYKDISPNLFEIQLLSRRPTLSTNFADAGFGTSQLLPLIVQAITPRPASLTIAEQPEIHLNPRLQSALADLFVDMATTGQRAIVETHSEHLLLRLRRLVASGKIKPSQIALYFVEKHEGESSVREVPIATNGHIAPSDWPEGFFEDALRESLALASAQT